MKTAELTGVQLDWAVAKCEGYDNLRKNPRKFDTELIMRKGLGESFHLKHLNFSADWSQGGPIIEREKINLLFTDDQWEADTSADCFGFGGTSLKAAMRCYVASKLGDEIEIPKELI